MIEKYVTFKSIIRYGGKSYFTAVEMNGLFILNETNKYCEFVGGFPNEEILQRDLYRGGAICKQTIYFAPFYAERIGCYDIKENRIFTINLPDIFKNKTCANVPKMLGVVSYKNAVFFFARCFPACVCLEVQTGKMSMILLTKNPYEDTKERHLFAVKYVRKRNIIYIPCYGRGNIIIFSLEKRNISEMEIECQHGFNDVVYDSERKNFWFIVRNSAELLSWDGKSPHVKRYSNPLLFNKKIVFTEFFHKSNLLYLISFKYKECYTFDLEEKKFKKTEIKNCKEFDGFYFCGKLRDAVWTFERNTGELISLDGKQKMYKIKCINAKNIKSWLSYVKSKGILYEDRVFSLDDYFQCVHNKKRKNNTVTESGRKIYCVTRGISI